MDNLIKRYEAMRSPAVFIPKLKDKTTGNQIVKTPTGDEVPTVKITNAEFTSTKPVEVRGSKDAFVSDSRPAKSEELLIKPSVIKSDQKILNKDIWTPYKRDEDIDRTLSWSVFGSATWLNRSTVRLTRNIEGQVGAVGAKNTTRSNDFNLSFEFRIYGSDTLYYADGIGLFYSLNQLGGAGDGGGIPPSDLVFSAYIDTFNNTTNSNANTPTLKIQRSGFSNIESAPDSGLRSEEWQTLSVVHENNLLSVSVGGFNYVNLPTITTPGSDYYFRISASTGTFRDIHEVRKIKFSGRRIGRR